MSETHHFQAEIEQLLDIVIHSLYTDRDIFIRELISNAADACEKLRFLQSSGTPVLEAEVAPTISLTTDDKAHTLTVADTGIGMSRAELVENLGTIAHSGTKAFLKQLAENQRPDAHLIGQFGVGFYSAFMAARKVEVLTRSATNDESGWRWTSESAGGYEIEPAPGLPRGTRVIVHLKDDAKSFAEAGRVRRIVERYSSFIQFPIQLNAERLSTVQAIWARNRHEVPDADYDAFYQFVGHDGDTPLLRLHFTAEAPLVIQALLFVPKRNWESAGLGRTEPGVHLYCRKILIDDRIANLLPEWLRFLKGVVDSEDLPLNISREKMQDSALLEKINKVLTGRFLKFLEETAEKDAERFQAFYAEYGRFLKEGVATDVRHREALSKLLRYESSALDKGAMTSMADYVGRMPAEQKELYYLLAPTREAAESSPYFEAFKSRGFEVLFVQDPIDEFVMEHLHEFGGKPVRAAEQADIDAATPAFAANALSDFEAEGLAGWLKDTLADRVGKVRPSKRLVDSPAVVVEADRMMTTGMRRILKAVQKDGAAAPNASPDLEINPRHPIVVGLHRMRGADSPLAEQVAQQLLDNALVAAGLLEDPRAMLARLNELLERVLRM
jgi:TNF receptor-associated protein 1